MAAAQLQRAAHAVAARAAREEAARAPAGLTAEQNRLVGRLQELQDARDWRGVVALEKEALALARELRGADPETARAIHSVLGNGFLNVGEYGRTIR